MIDMGEDIKELIEKAITDTAELNRPERIRELIIITHLYTNYVIDMVLKKHHLLKTDNNVYQEEVLDRIPFPSKIALLKNTIEQFELDKDGVKKDIIINNLHDLNKNRNRMAHDLEAETLTFCGTERKKEECLEMILKCFLPLIFEILDMEVMVNDKKIDIMRGEHKS
jgi:hypothetical protein